MSRFKSDEAIEIFVDDWYSELRKLSLEELRAGFGKVKDQFKKWPPELLEFIHLCELDYKDLGLPDYETAYEMALKRDWTFPFVWHVMQEADSFKVRTKPEKFAKQRFKDAYDKLLKQAAGGKDFSIPETTGIEYKKESYTQEQIQTAREEFLRMIGR